ncbi:hypothetical protein AB2B38_006100 [Balneola sp. MJW-20]|uniref:hypothetical protein n=1 Tax=Gracilimonas aurantiaca TaxID=3234185 RepID=UPI003467E5A9
MKNIRLNILVVLILAGSLTFMQGCDTIFGSKQDDTTDEIFDEGRIDPNLEKVDGYAPVLPVWENFDAPTDVYVGFDTFVYVTDSEGLHVLDRADLAPRVTFPMKGAVSVVQDRLLNVYVAGRIDTVIENIDPNITWDLPVIYKVRNLNGTGPVEVVDTLIFPFADASLSTTAAKQSRLDRNSALNYELVEVTGLTVLTDNTLYVTRRGPFTDNSQVAAPDNIVLEFQPQVINGAETDQMVNVRQIRTLSPTTPSLLSGIGMSDIQGLIGPPQRDTFTDDRSFIIAQAEPGVEIPFRVLWVNAVETTDGLIFESNADLLRKDTAAADSFLYDAFKFDSPSGLAFAGDQTRFIFVVDQAQHKLYQFQANGQEGVNPPAGAADQRKRIIVSFGGLGSGPKQFREPSGVAYFDRVVYVADKGNNRIVRYKLTSDFE